MTKNYSGKIAFVGVMVVIALFSRAVYPHLYFVATGSMGAAAASSSSAVPRFVLPALSLDVVSQRETSSSPADGASNAARAGAVSETLPTKSSAPIVTGAVSVALVGNVANSTFSRVHDAPSPSLAVEVALVADLASGARFMSENVAERWPLASITKLMTATVALDKLSSAQKITITKEAFNADPSEKTLRIGDTYTVADLLKILLLPSSNVAAEALASAYGRTQFITEMNARAAAWGMVDTHYVDPSGLAIGSQSTAADLVLLAQKIYDDYPKILTVTRTPVATVTEISSGNRVAVENINEFAGEADFIGGKTGYTDQANGNLLSIFSYGGHPVIVIVLGTDDGTRFADTQTLYNWFTENFRV